MEREMEEREKVRESKGEHKTCFLVRPKKHTRLTLWHHWEMVYRRTRRWRTEKVVSRMARLLRVSCGGFFHGVERVGREAGGAG